jgi:Elongation factor SelB, winged helix
VGQIRDAVGATRRVVVPLLESLDAGRVTVRVGDLRRLRAR